MSASVVFIVVVVLVVLAVIGARAQRDERNAKARNMICPHCQTQGTVSIRPTKVKRGISGGKATAAIFTGGLSLLATGLSRKEAHLRASCSRCGAEWLIH